MFETSALDPHECAELQQVVCAELVKSISIDWALIRWVYCATVSISEGIVETTSSDGLVTGHAPPREAVRALTDLREGMRDPERGTWFTATVVVDSSDRCDFVFDYENEPPFAPQVTDGIFATDFEYYPRSQEFTPEWLKRKLDGAVNDRNGVS